MTPDQNFSRNTTRSAPDSGLCSPECKAGIPRPKCRIGVIGTPDFQERRSLRLYLREFQDTVVGDLVRDSLDPPRVETRSRILLLVSGVYGLMRDLEVI